MHQRPIADLLEGLADLGVNLNSETGNGCPPVVVHAAGLSGRQGVSFGRCLQSVSQWPANGLAVCPETGGIVGGRSAGFAALCADDAGRDARPSASTCPKAICGGSTFRRRHYRGRVYSIEPDASAASYFFAAAAITGGEVTVEGLSRESLQGDVAFVDCLRKMPAAQLLTQIRTRSRCGPPTGKKLRGIRVNMNAISDTVQTLAAVALFADGPTTITGVGHIRHKETDRIGNLAIELRKFGATVDEFTDGLRIYAPLIRAATVRERCRLTRARIATYNDHRMAMSLALVGLRVPGVLSKIPNARRKRTRAILMIWRS